MSIDAAPCSIISGDTFTIGLKMYFSPPSIERRNGLLSPDEIISIPFALSIFISTLFMGELSLSVETSICKGTI